MIKANKNRRKSKATAAKSFFMYDNIRPSHSVIPGKTRNPVFLWIPAFAGMTIFAVVPVAASIGIFLNIFPPELI
jgi:hypothetical protein